MTDIVVLLDASGSMQSMKNEPVQAMNSFIKEQKKANVPGSLFSLYTFATNITKVYDSVDLSTVEEYKDYVADGMTKLFDCIKQAITDKRERKNVVLVIITDGDDTASQKCKSEEAKSLLKEQQDKENWQVVFLGANQDSFKASNSLGIRASSTAAYSQANPGNLCDILRQVSAPIALFRESFRDSVSDSERAPPSLARRKLDLNYSSTDAR